MSYYTQNGPYTTPFLLWIPTIVTVKGVEKKTYSKTDDVYYCSFRTFGGTEKVVNDVIVLEDTATIETWYNPTITAACQIEVNSQRYEILGTPENINMRNQYMKIRVRAIKGGA